MKTGTLKELDGQQKGLFGISVEYDDGDVLHKISDVIYYKQNRYEVIEINFTHFGVDRFSSKVDLVMRLFRDRNVRVATSRHY